MSELHGVLRWEAPTPSAHGGYGLRRVKPDPMATAAEQLKARPGEWAVVFEGLDGQASGLASKIKRGLSPAWQPAGDFDAKARKCGDKTATYARYVGEVTR